MDANTQNPSKKTKVKLDFKDSKYATGRRKLQLQKFGLKKDLVKFMLMVNFIAITLLVKTIKCKLQDLLKS